MVPGSLVSHQVTYFACHLLMLPGLLLSRLDLYSASSYEHRNPSHVEMVIFVPCKMILLFFLGYLSQIAASLSVVPSLQHIPPGVRAACRVTLAKNVTQCSEAFHKQLKYIHSSTLPEICTEDCANGLSSLYSEALSRCGTDTVDITVNDTVIAIFRPLDLVGKLKYKYNTTCLQDKHPFPFSIIQKLTFFLHETAVSAKTSSRT